MHADKLAYFFIAFAVVLLLKAFAICTTGPLINVLLYASISVSLLASNIPRVVDIPLHFAYPVKRIEYFTFFVAIVCFIALCIRHIWS